MSVLLSSIALGGSVLRRAVLRGAVLRGAVLRGNVWRGTVLRGAVLGGLLLRCNHSLLRRRGRQIVPRFLGKRSQSFRRFGCLSSGATLAAALDRSTQLPEGRASHVAVPQGGQRQLGRIPIAQRNMTPGARQVQSARRLRFRTGLQVHQRLLASP
ncbi:MAG: pentapeptide repeat-containing protein [Acidobacteriota bacterium]